QPTAPVPNRNPSRNRPSRRSGGILSAHELIQSPNPDFAELNGIEKRGEADKHVILIFFSNMPCKRNHYSFECIFYRFLILIERRIGLESLSHHRYNNLINIHDSNAFTPETLLPRTEWRSDV